MNTPKKFAQAGALFVLLMSIAFVSFSQTVTSNLDAVIRPVAPHTTTIELDRLSGGWGGAGGGTYVWSSSPSTGITFGTYAQGGGSAGDVTVTIGAAAQPGNYTFTLTRGSASASVTVQVGNLAASFGSNWVEAFSTNTANGNLVVPQPNQIFDPAQNTAALGIDVQGRFYYIPNDGANGVMDLYGSLVNGANVQLIDAGVDVNGSGNNNNLGFVRLAIRDDNTGYFVAGDGSTVYIGQFSANGNSSTNVTGVTTVTLVGGTASEFQNGDICFSGSGQLFALANDGAGNTYIYTSSPPYTTFSKKWTLVGPGGVPFTGAVNGCAFDAVGSMYISGSSIGLYYIDQNTVNTFGVGTVVTTQKWSGTGITDLASNLYPIPTTLPVKISTFTVARTGNHAQLKWTTASELNSQYFDIERSEDGVNFNAVGRVNAAGHSNSSINYLFNDLIPNLAPRILYYRLKDVAIDGKAAYSKIVALKLDGKGSLGHLNIYPNPFVGDVKISYTSQGDHDAVVRISNVAGQMMLTRKVSVQDGDNVIVISGLEKLAPGIHILELTVNEEKIVRRIVKE